MNFAINSLSPVRTKTNQPYHRRTLPKILIIGSLALVITLNSACSSAYVFNHCPTTTEKVFRIKITSLERRIKRHPDRRDLLLEAASSYTQYAYVFLVEEADRVALEDYLAARRLYKQALHYFQLAVDYGTTALEQRYPTFNQWLEDTTQATPQFDVEDVSALYWLAASYGGAVSASRGDPRWLVHFPKIGLLLKEALKLNPTWNQGALYSAMISYTVKRPDPIPDRYEIARDYFNKAIAASEGRSASPYVVYAESVLISKQDRTNFIKQLESVLKMDVREDKELQLANLVAQKRAAWLLDHVDEFFY
ncbi:MAG: TRAP transporter TatT component family protein [Fidelibacterota bacterium]